MEKINEVTSIAKNVFENIFFITLLFIIIAFCFEFFWERDLVILHKYLSDFFVLNQDINTRYFYKAIFNFTSIVVKKILFVLVILIIFLTFIRQFCYICSETFDFCYKKIFSSIIVVASFDILFQSFINITYKGYFLPNISDVYEKMIHYISYWVFTFLFLVLIYIIYEESNCTYHKMDNDMVKLSKIEREGY